MGGQPLATMITIGNDNGHAVVKTMATGKGPTHGVAVVEAVLAVSVGAVLPKEHIAPDHVRVTQAVHIGNHGVTLITQQDEGIGLRDEPVANIMATVILTVNGRAVVVAVDIGNCKHRLVLCQSMIEERAHVKPAALLAGGSQTAV
ncbi:MAG: hypothetical protein OEV45_02095 [Desulfobacteraceae bacterium]|nr:hypothetical protein [Desulfobacteraceae bacterium]